MVASAGGKLIVEGSKAIDIFALNHLESGFFAGGDMVLRSASNVGGDAHYWSGGSFRIENLDGIPGNWFSPNDPIIRASGDVSFNSYEGASLHIFTGGSINISGNVFITSPDTIVSSIQESITLSDGKTVVNIEGNAQPTLDIRAGTTDFGTPGDIGNMDGFSDVPNSEGIRTSGNISIESITNSGGLVFLTNQYRPNNDLSGDISVGALSTAPDPASGINGGPVVIDSRGTITFNEINVSGTDFNTFFTSNLGGDGGDVTLFAQNDIFMPFPSSIISDGLRGGAITLTSNTAVIQENAPRGFDPFSLSTIKSETFAPVKGGEIRLTAPLLELGGNIFSNNEAGRGGDIFLTTNSLVTNQSTIATQVFGSGTAGNISIVTDSLTHSLFSQIGSANLSSTGGQAGNVNLEAKSISAEGGSQIASLTFGIGNAGNISVTAQDILLSGVLAKDLAEEFTGELFIPTAIISSAQPNSEGNSGNISIITDTLSVTEGASIITTAFGVGNAGNITIDADQSILVDGAVFFEPSNTIEASAITSEIFQGATGDGGDIKISTQVLDLTNGGTITTVSDGNGDAGSIGINATKSISIDGIVKFDSFDRVDLTRTSQIAVVTADNGTGDGGTLSITSSELSFTNNGRLLASTLNVGNAGKIILNVGDNLFIDGEGSGIFSDASADSVGQGGSISIGSPLVIVKNDGTIGVDSRGAGEGGSISIASDLLQILDRGRISAEAASNQGGNITLDIQELLSFTNNGEITATAGTAQAGGNGGNIAINSDFIVGFPTQEQYRITANAFAGNGGNIEIFTNGIFGAEFFDISASSQLGLEGTISINTPDVNPLQGLDSLPTEVVDASQLIAKRCLAGEGATTEQQSEFTITGRGGLPPKPQESLRGDAVLSPEWLTLDSETAEKQRGRGAKEQKSIVPPQIVQVTGWVIRPNGKVSLTADNPDNPNSVPLSPGINHPRCHGAE